MHIPGNSTGIPEILPMVDKKIALDGFNTNEIYFRGYIWYNRIRKKFQITAGEIKT